MKNLWFVFLLLSVIAVFADPAEPENLLVDGYTFIRPAKWIWEALPENKNPKYLNHFLVPGKSKQPQTEVGFFRLDGVVGVDLKKRVQSNFRGEPEYSEVSVALSKTNLTYVRGRGTEKIHKPFRDNWLLIGVMLCTKDRSQAFFVRIFGPEDEVQAAEADFKKMVERAVAETDE